MATLSFYPAHHITMGEGGAVYTNNLRLKIIAESFRDWGRDCYCKTGHSNTCTKRFGWKFQNLPEGYDHKYVYTHLGYNLKITDMQAACALAQLDKLEAFIKKRKENFNYLYEGLKSCQEFINLPQATINSEPSWFGFPVTLNDSSPFGRREIIEYLTSKNIGTRLLFAGNLAKQPSMKNQKFRVHGNLHNTDNIMNSTFWVGVYPGLNNNMLDYIIEHMETILGKNF